MKKSILLAFYALVIIATSAKADPRYVIVERVGQRVQWTQPSYETREGKDKVEILRRVSADKYNGCDFWNENSQGVAVRCGFRSDRSAIVLVNESGEPLYLVGCRGGTFYNRIKLIRKEKEVRPVAPVERVQPVIRRQIVCEEKEVSFKTGATFGEYDTPHSMEFGITPRYRERYCPPRPIYVPRPVLVCPPPRVYVPRERYCPPPRYERHCPPPRPYCSPNYPPPKAAPGWRG